MAQLGVRGVTEKLNIGGRMVTHRPTENDAADSILYGFMVLDASTRGGVVASLRAGRMVAPDMAKCSRCGDVKPLLEFSPHSMKVNGAQSWCLACHREYMRAYRRNKKHSFDLSRQSLKT